MDESFSALFAVYFEALRYLDPNFREGLEARRSTIPPEALRMPTLPEALESLSGERGRVRHRKHASLALSLLHWTLNRRQTAVSQVEQHAESIASFLRAHDVDLAGLSSARDASEAFLAPLAGTCAPSGFWIRTLFLSGTDLTICAAGVQVDRAASDFKQMIDPRVWHTTVPETFAQTFRTDEIPVVPSQDPSDADAGGYQPPLGEAWKSTLFEQANWPLGGLFITARNLLRIDYQHLPQGSVTPERYFLRYALSECLTTSAKALSLPFLDQLGGIDTDSGFFEARTLSNGKASLSAKKCLRFKGELAWLNAISPAYLFTWLSLSILSGACYQFSLEAEASS